MKIVKKHAVGSALLVELLIVILFYVLSLSVLIEVFSASYTMSNKARNQTVALNRSQNIAEMLYVCDDVQTELTALGFAQQEDAWTLTEQEITYRVTERTDGALREMCVQAEARDEVLLTLPCSRCIGEEEQP